MAGLLTIYGVRWLAFRVKPHWLLWSSGETAIKRVQIAEGNFVNSMRIKSEIQA